MLLSIIWIVSRRPQHQVPSHATSLISSIVASSTNNPIAEAVARIQNGFAPDDIKNIPTDAYTGSGSSQNSNTRNPSQPVYPKKERGDAPYSLSESALRAAIYIPSSFTYGRTTPLIMVPGTGSTGYLTYRGNFIKQFTGSSFADPVWLNIPDFLYDDAQVNAEYVAYAINYIAGISRNKSSVSVMAWSQGNLDTQWALKYWPSTRKVVTDLVSISPDFHGTTTANTACPLGTPCPPAVIQQEYDSNFVRTLRKNGGDSAYVPTTTVYTATDTIVIPQSGANASAIIKDARGVGVSNSELQVVCAGGTAGVYATHEGMLYNSLSYALAVDALTHPGPGKTNRLNLRTVCNQPASPGLTVEDIAITEENIVIALVANLAYPDKVTVEPPIKPYATS
ncbi:alpha/beta-hydrolase [Tothia fuscella]|uniref:Alpha/beta-hydrolase n=1 Tax=Tothia fuscella TaxID=1048955 RepID=A0A9P4NN16_9PEZI|nr:alpha/beta-hydrolase [Tothia fuscella]